MKRVVRQLQERVWDAVVLGDLDTNSIPADSLSGQTRGGRYDEGGAYAAMLTETILNGRNHHDYRLREADNHHLCQRWRDVDTYHCDILEVGSEMLDQ